MVELSVLSAGPAEPRFFSEFVTAPPPPFSSGLGTGKGGVAILHAVLVSKIFLAPSDINFTLNLKRQEFPLRLAFPMTINKAQGQTFTRVCLLLQEPVFTHGQLYVAFSRLGSVSAMLSFEQRANINFFVKLKRSFTETLALMNDAYEEEKLSRTPVHFWYKRFKDSIEDYSRSGRLLTSTTDRNFGQVPEETTEREIKEMVVREKLPSQNYISTITNVPLSPVNRIIKEKSRLKNT
ncbi:hypothetical protein LAZ67_14001225 [Cordylochernes scorpioides]|uniref:Mos1 transposase HTH domain-containing protein n=1 Tax=Cordylochernes scorpioides TaxID=51811 RepID=A0ABY6L8I6_9ARAC|nr:hypothetical protein LAZ67_14001225 [Cordylochernes scorpioides]